MIETIKTFFLEGWTTLKGTLKLDFFHYISVLESPSLFNPHNIGSTLKKAQTKK